MSIVKAALVQTAWNGDKESIIDLQEQYMREAAAQGAKSCAFRNMYTTIAQD